MATPGSEAGRNVTEPSMAEVAVAACVASSAPWRADGVRRAGRRPGVERLIERDRAAGHGVAVHVEQAKRDLAGRARGGEVLAGPGDRLEQRVLRTRAVGRKCNALAGSVEAGVDADDLALGERADGERLGGDARGVGDRGSRTLGRNAATGRSLPCDGLAGEGRAVRKDESLHGPGESGAGGERKLRRERGKRRAAVPPPNCACRLEPLVSEAVTMDQVPSLAMTFMVARPSPVAVTEQIGKTAGERGRAGGDSVDDGDAAGGRERGRKSRDGEGKRHADGDGVRGRGDEGERVACAGVVTDAAGNDGCRIKGGQVVDFNIDGTGDAGGRGRRNGRDLVGRDAGDERGLAADENRVGEAKAQSP